MAIAPLQANMVAKFRTYRCFHPGTQILTQAWMQDIMDLGTRVITFEERLRAGDPQLNTPTGKVLDKVKHHGHLVWTSLPVLLSICN